MKCCIVGAGAIGGHLAVKLQASGQEVSVLARGAQLAAIREAGLALEQDGQLIQARLAASQDANDFGPQELVFVATKATALPGMAAQIAPLVGTGTMVAFLQNGMPWWYPIGLSPARPTPPALPIFRAADEFLKVMRPDQVIGGIVYSANELVRPGLIRNNSPKKNAIELAAIDDRVAEGVQLARAALVGAGIDSPRLADIRAAVWLKLVGNTSASSICVATGNPGAIATDPAIQTAFLRMVEECIQVAVAHGCAIAGQMDFSRWTQHRSQHKPSMLQDYEAGRVMEVAEMVLAPVAFARAAGLATPTLDAITAIAARLAADRGLYVPA